MASITLNPSQETYVISAFPDTNFSNSSSFYVGVFHTNDSIHRSLLQFDISSIPLISTIASSKLKLYVYRNDVPELSKPIHIFRLLNYFNQNTVTYSNQPLVPYASEATFTLTSGTGFYIEWDITNLVAGWHNGSIPNTGIIIKGVEDTPSLVGFTISNSSDSRQWPLLEIEYIPGILNTYATETVTTTDNFTYSIPISLISRIGSFGIKNIGSNDAEVVLQLSLDGITWFDDIYPFVSNSVLPPGTTTILTTSAYMNYARVSFKSNSTNQSTQLNIYPSTKEP
ncbi:DNRLRE domain-containing protein [Tepidibacter mesophilus]|uniref:DNRLRE domain-containing protein n=1 Tax=Tepidibacter mesophilus TaxID=655607 RepID=UPI000C06C0E9|nr:DNRLRE domain-containing protein [Tepidibacter mesophilus]